MTDASTNLMKAISQTEKGPSSVLKVIEVPKPTARGHDLVVKIKAVSVNPLDILVRKSPEAFSIKDKHVIAGWDASGTVEAVGERVTRFEIGDEVFFAGSLNRPGSNAEYALVDERITGHRPKSLSWEDAAALPLTSLAAWEALVEKMRIPVATSSETNPKSLLIIAGAGGVGSIAISIASKILNLSTVVATASRPETAEYCKARGATHIINHREPLRPQLDKAGIAVDYVFICYDADQYIVQAFDLVKPLGHVVSIASLSENVSLGKWRMKSVSFSWEAMFTKSITGECIETQGHILDEISRRVDQGLLQTTASQRYRFNVENLKMAHDLVESGKGAGRIVLRVEDTDW
ncbi:uncharacterized protein VTP21DRAFT_9972 [Calcarisporiella thermophila]|uniref:uncharacterized protein n=1 Tax=Calcarisporiella thermophila TaxID=911321 RepID=UPI003743F4E7